MGNGRARIIVWLVLVLETCTGCGAGNLEPVEGKVTLDSTPLADATVMLSPARGTGPGPFVDTTDAAGRFALGPTDKNKAGAAAGEYLVIITTVKTDPNAHEGTPVSTQKEVVPVAWRNGSQRFEVPEGGTKEVNFEMKSR